MQVLAVVGLGFVLTCVLALTCRRSSTTQKQRGYDARRASRVAEVEEEIKRETKTWLGTVKFLARHALTLYLHLVNPRTTGNRRRLCGCDYLAVVQRQRRCFCAVRLSASWPCVR